MIPQKTAWILVACLLAVVVIVGVVGVGRSRVVTQNVAPESQVPELPVASPSPSSQVQLSLTSTAPVVRLGDSVVFALNVDPLTPPLTAATLHWHFKPEDLEVIAMEKGEMWENEFPIENVIDNTLGTANYSAAREKTSADTGKSSLLLLTITPKRTGEISLSLDDDTLLTRGNNETVEFSPATFNVTVQ